MIPIVYNLFPTLVGPPDRWRPHAERARAMGFTWLYVNPYQYPGFSGSLYATKLYDRLHPALEPSGPGSGRDLLARAFQDARALGLGVMVDLVVNHTSKDSPLVTEHPTWFRHDAAGGGLASPSVADPADTRRVVVWGDLAEVDNAGSPDREALWRFWEGLVDQALDLGVGAFRADAAYKVPAALWQRLIGRARQRDPGAVFVAETLGCTLEQMTALGGVGFDYFYNSSKWWDFAAPWALEQHERFRRLAPSISFPESHDTPRLAAETGGSEPVQRQRYAFAAMFSAGLQMPIGYEWGFGRALDVVKTRPEDWESPRFDISIAVGRVNYLKSRHPLLGGEGVLRLIDWRAPGVAVLRRWSDDAGTHRGVIAVNRDASREREVAVDRGELPPAARLFRPALHDWPNDGAPVPDRIRLQPAEVVLLAGAL
jgi:starch synthase (maltosyl-transferring)